LPQRPSRLRRVSRQANLAEPAPSVVADFAAAALAPKQLLRKAAAALKTAAAFARCDSSTEQVAGFSLCVPPRECEFTHREWVHLWGLLKLSQIVFS
jgi:hypothetical protein